MMKITIMPKKHVRRSRVYIAKKVFVILAVIASLIVSVFYLSQASIPVLQPQGVIASKERTLIIITVVLGMFVVVPVFIMLFVIAWKYRAGNIKAKYTPEVSGSRKLETLWWVIPCMIILILAIITGISTHDLDPYKPIVSSVKPVNVQVVALDWKWLFIYPDLGVATVNYLPLPVHTPIHFTITSDAPMNSFWIPSLGGQVYAMSGMSTQLNLMADSIGSYNGVSANISGAGFAGMKFIAQSMSSSDFNLWVHATLASSNILTFDTYTNTLVQESQNNKPTNYALLDNTIYNKVQMKYMAPESDGNTSMQGMMQ
jgi:cytochrome o ubiquinol oxidase subunit 2